MTTAPRATHRRTGTRWPVGSAAHAILPPTGGRQRTVHGSTTILLSSNFPDGIQKWPATNATRRAALDVRGRGQKARRENVLRATPTITGEISPRSSVESARDVIRPPAFPPPPSRWPHTAARAFLWQGLIWQSPAGSVIQKTRAADGSFGLLACSARIVIRTGTTDDLPRI